MRIPRIPVGQFQGKNWATTNPAGKGSWPPRNISDETSENLGRILGPKKDVTSFNGHTRIVYPGNGRKILITVGPDGSESRVETDIPVAKCAATPRRQD